MKITKENAVTVKNIYFFVTVFLVQCILIAFMLITSVCLQPFVKNSLSREMIIVLGFMVVTLIWYIALHVGVYNIFQTKKIAKKNLKPLKQCIKKDWVIFIMISVLLLCGNDVLFMIGVGSLIVNYPLLTRVFDRIARNYYKTI